MAELKDEQSGQGSKGIGGKDPRENNLTSTGRGESGSARDESSRGVARSTSSGRMSNESDLRERDPSTDTSVTMGSNGGGRDDDQPAGTDSGRQPQGTEVHSHERRKAS